MVVLAVVGCSPQTLSGTSVGAGHASGDAPRSLGEQSRLTAVALTQEYDLPPWPDDPADVTARFARDTQVYRRAQLLGLDVDTPSAVWDAAEGVVAADRDILPALLERPLRKLHFDGTLLSELGALVATAGPAHITVSSRTLVADVALTIVEKDVVLDFAGAVIEAGARPPVWLIELRGARNVVIMNAEIAGGMNGILVQQGSNISLHNNDIHDLTQNGIVVTGASTALSIQSNRLHQLQRSGVMLHGPVSAVLIEKNDFSHLLGHSNWNAAILLTGRRGDVAADPEAFFLPDGHWVVEEPIFERMRNPERNIILDNDIRDGLSSGIYNDGAIANLFVDNRIEGNAKEGVCFDNGATANVFAGNVVTGNGQRWGQPDDVLASESVLAEGRGGDGTAIAKLPGISIDNAIYNQIYANEISDNWGGGIKMVRTSMYNLVVRNTLTDNNLGQSERVHFFGIELGAAHADVPATDLDFVGSSGNILFGNEIHGSHYSGIYLAPGSVQNELLDNDIDGVEAFEVERP